MLYSAERMHSLMSPPCSKKCNVYLNLRAPIWLLPTAHQTVAFIISRESISLLISPSTLSVSPSKFALASEGDEEQKEDKNHYVYICKKMPEADLRLAEWGKVKEELELEEMQEM